MKIFKGFFFLLLFYAGFFTSVLKAQIKQPVDYVNPYIGNTSHLLVPTYPTVHLPNSLLRVYPERENFTGNTIKGLPLMITSHRGSAAFSISPYQGNLKGIKSTIDYGYDNEIIKPYYYKVDLDDYGINVQYAPSQQAGIYEFRFKAASTAPYLILNTNQGGLTVKGNTVSGYQYLANNTKVYIMPNQTLSPLHPDNLKEIL
jgi:hypothetical protein